MEPTFGSADGTVQVHVADLFDILPQLPAASVDAVVCDPPYALDGGFMRRDWDDLGGPAEFADWTRRWVEAAAPAVRPGGPVVAFGAARTHHRLLDGIRRAGLEVVGTGAFVYRSGFAKNSNMSWQIDRVLGAERPVAGWVRYPGMGVRGAEDRGDAAGAYGTDPRVRPYTLPGSDLAKRWDGWGAAVKPAWEAYVVGRVPGGDGPCRVPLWLDVPKASLSEKPWADIVAAGGDVGAHPTVKGLELMRRLVAAAAPDGGTVLDPFAGSGTTGEAAVQTGRGAVLVEQEPSYARWIARRLERSTFAPVVGDLPEDGGRPVEVPQPSLFGV